MDNYRNRIYRNYGTDFQNAEDILTSDKVKRWKKGYRYYFRDWLPVDKNASVIELACGNGRMLGLIKDLGYSNITGIDVSPEQVNFARHFHENVVQSDAMEWLKTHPNSYDLIICMDLIEHLYKPEVLPFLEDCFNSLISGGRLILQTTNSDSLWGSSMRYIDFTHEASFTFRSLSSLLSLVGFHYIEGRECGPVPIGHSIKSSIRFLIWQIIRIGLIIWNYAEMGISEKNLFSRVFLIKADKPTNLT
ncbi:MAG: class I SAM-dependent methyltransferase [Anaerolineae bacterium]|nr:class I SAM-dependent methyltransferase [Anaerolineae bacterium]